MEGIVYEDRNGLFTFLTYDEFRGNNNNAEHAIKALHTSPRHRGNCQPQRELTNIWCFSASPDVQYSGLDFLSVPAFG